MKKFIPLVFCFALIVAVGGCATRYGDDALLREVQSGLY